MSNGKRESEKIITWRTLKLCQDVGAFLRLIAAMSESEPFLPASKTAQTYFYFPQNLNDDSVAAICLTTFIPEDRNSISKSFIDFKKRTGKLKIFSWVDNIMKTDEYRVLYRASLLSVTSSETLCQYRVASKAVRRV